jgi:predicted TIM-barrel fold metal-dependent hydrolase
MKIVNLPDDAAISAETVFTLKEEKAPGAIDFRKRHDVLDFMGVRCQMVYPGLFGLNAAVFYGCADDTRFYGTVTGDRRGYARKLLDAHNDWCARQSRAHDRFRFVAVLLGDSPDALVADARRLINAGVRAFWLPCHTPPGGRSPAHLDLDPLWALLADAGAPVLSHVGDGKFLATTIWREAREFEGWKTGGEFTIDPWSLCSYHLSTQNFLTTMIMGGVFERHPTLKFAAAEVGAYWVGQLGQLMDLWYANNRKFMQVGGTCTLTMKPSEYLRRNVRVSGFDIEDIGAYIDQFGMPEIYCYTADFPHHEGGKRPMETFLASIRRHGPDVIRGFFVDNGKMLFAN